MRFPLFNLFFNFLLATSMVYPKSEYLFSPRGNITERIIEEINKAKQEIYAAVYMITSKKIVDALINAHNKGVIIKIVTDHGCIQSPYGKAYHLMQAGIPVKIYYPPGSNKKFPPLMHAKYAIIDQKISIEGSFNWTNSAELFNEEHVRITDNTHQKEALYKRFQTLFNERATDQFSCHLEQINAWNKKNAPEKIIIPPPPHLAKNNLLSSPCSQQSETEKKNQTRFWLPLIKELNNLLQKFITLP
jgi:phosphatidylserine/phosphatidylglycerophosphate/cardiolipin synthase-like enzyme